MINEDILIDNGYKIFEVDTMHKGANALYQKKIKDEDGVRYAICFYEWEIFDNLDYEMEVNFYYYNHIEKIHYFNMTKNITLEQIENDLARRWRLTDCGYQEQIQ